VRMAETSDNADPGIVGSSRGRGSDESSERDVSLDGRVSEIDALSIGSDDGDVGAPLTGVVSEDGGGMGAGTSVGDGSDVVELVNVFFA
jgi:hypothetical protein